MSGADRRASEALQLIAEGVDEMLNIATGGEGMGFCLVVFPTEENSRASYVSNCERQQVIDALETLLDHWRQGLPDVPAHEVN